MVRQKITYDATLMRTRTRHAHIPAGAFMRSYCVDGRKKGGAGAGVREAMSLIKLVTFPSYSRKARDAGA